MQESTNKDKSQKISDFLSTNKVILIGILSALILAVVVVGILNTVSENKSEAAFEASLELEDLADQELIDKADDLIKNYKNTYAELKAYSALASYYFDKKDFEKAYENYKLAYTEFPETLSTSTNMFNAAMSLVELEKNSEAISVLEELVTKYKSEDTEKGDLSGDVPEAILNLGILYEVTGDSAKAIEQYETLVANYSSTSYQVTNLAKSRLLKIK